MSFTSNMGNHEHPQHASSYASTHVSHGGQAQGQVPKEPQARKHRKLNRSAPQLKRNAACLPCRRRRIKCDAAKPACGSCVRSFQFLARTNPDAERDRAGVQCYYEEDEDEEESGGRGADDRVREGSGDPHATVRRLEAKVGESSCVDGIVSSSTQADGYKRNYNELCRKSLRCTIRLPSTLQPQLGQISYLTLILNRAHTLFDHKRCPQARPIRAILHPHPSYRTALSVRRSSRN